jgi:site-specific DNA-methyltransferase (adenine-specific)
MVEGVELLHGDCLELMRDIPDGSVDMILCDLPYGTTQCKWDSVIPFEPLWGHYKRLIKPNGAIALTASQPFTSALVMSNISNFRHGWVYKKLCASNFAQAKYAPMKEHEDVLIFSFNGKPRFFPIKEERRGGGSARAKYGYSDASRHNVGEFVGIRKGDYNPVSETLRFPSSVREFNNRGRDAGGYTQPKSP